MESLLVKSESADTFVESDYIHAESEDDSISERNHDRLLDAVSSVSSSKKTVGKQRHEPVSSASEFHATGSQGKLQLHELVGAIPSSGSNADVKKSLGKIEKNEKVLAVPLPKHEKERIERTVAYETTCVDLKKWDPVVQKNRKADQLQFPLQQPDIRLINSKNSLKNFQPRTPLEKEVAALLYGSDNVLQNNKLLTRAEEKALKAMSLEEAKARRAELQKHRALLSYKEAKSKRTKKIKSKRYHRILRKEKLKLEKKTLEELEKTDPEAYLEKLQQLDRQRMQERMNLKHRGGSKFMKRQAIYAKYDDSARQSVQDMIQKNKELTQKLVQSDDEETEMHSDGGSQETVTMATDEVHNPWMSSGGGRRKSSVITRPETLVNKEAIELNAQLENDSSDVSDDADDTKCKSSERIKTTEQFGDIDDIFNKAEKDKQKAKLLERKVRKQLAKERKEEAEARRAERREQRKKLKKRRKDQKSREEESGDSDSSDSETESEASTDEENKTGQQVHDGNSDADELMVSLERKNKLEDFEGTEDIPKVLTYTPDITAFTAHKSDKTDEHSLSRKKPTQKGHKSKEVRLDPSKYFTVETSVNHAEVSDLVEEGEEQGREDQQRMTIAQAFASDDIVEEFMAQKAEAEERDKPKDIDLSLPGWGEWGGEGIQPSKKKQHRFIIKAPKAPPRKDRNLPNVIISQTKDTTIAKHQVSQLPFPFTNVHEFQKSIRQPIGRTWMPETSYKEMIQPKVTTKLGTIIDPINKEETFKNSHKNDFKTEENKHSERTGKSDLKNRKRKSRGK